MLKSIKVPLNPAFSTTQVVSALNHLQVSHLIIGAETNLPYKPPRSNLPLIRDLIADAASKTLTSTAVSSLRHIIVSDNSSSRVDLKSLKPIHFLSELFYSSNSASGTRPSLAEPLHRDDIINIQFTSGTTSAPKAASLTHTSILNNGFSIGSRMLLTPSDVVVCPPPLFHCFGCVLGYMATATHGASIVFPAPVFDALATLHAVQEEKATALYGVPTMFLPELDLLSTGAVSRTGLQHLRTGIAAGSSIPAELMRRLHRDLNLTQLTICYGMTETSPVSLMTATSDPLDKRLDSVGRLLPHVAAKITSPADRTRVLPVGRRGELAVSGYLLMKGYWNDAARTAEATSVDERGERWMHTGDEAEMDAEGYVRITGRLRDLIIRGGENVQPLEVENCILGMAEVGDVSVVGVKDERYGEVVGAFVVAKGGEGGEERRKGERGGLLEAEDIRRWVREKMSGHLVPKYVFFVPGFPKTASGKVQKFLLREMAERLVAEGKGFYRS